MNGKVFLIGSGSGDVGLMTVKGLNILSKADVVIYDRLVSDEILNSIPPTAEKIDVGKQPLKHKIPQWRINEILAEKYLANPDSIIVRLKGGDPFVFGRGGEELDYLSQHNIPFEVVPGITSAIAVPAYAGIPVTHRDFSSSIHIITGHTQKDLPLNIDFEALVKMQNSTFVFLMGMASLEKIVKGFLNAGMSENMPVAIIENGSTPYQRKVIAALGDIVSKAQKQNFKNPAIILIGKVANLSDKFDWYCKLPLFGKQIIVTRPLDRQKDLSGKMRNLGAKVFEIPAIETAELDDNKLIYIFKSLDEFEWLAFTSSTGVEIFFKNLWEAGFDSRKLSNIKIAVIGSATAKTLEKYNIRADYMPDIYDSEHLASGLLNKLNGKLLIPRALNGSKVLTDILTANNKSFIDLPIYSTDYCVANAEKLKNILSKTKNINDRIYVTFTSGSTVEGFEIMLKQLENYDAIKQNIIAVSIGKQTSKVCEKYGFNTFTANECTINSIIGKIVEISI